LVWTVFDNVLKKVRFEVELLVVVAIFSLVSASLLIADAASSFVVEKYGVALTVVRISQLIFGVGWLFLSIKFIVEINRLRRKHFFFYYVHRLERLEEEQKKSKATELVRDLVAFYRSYYLKVMTVLALAIVAGFVILVAAAYLLLCGYMSFWVAVFRWVLDSCMLLVASALYVHVHRSWGRKLLRVKDAEKKLSEMLGGPIEA